MTLNHRLLQSLLFPLGVTAIVIGGMIIIWGVLPTLHVFESALALSLDQAIVLEPLSISPTIDNEFRFYAVFWLSYGVLTIWVAIQIEARHKFVPFIFLVFFLGGLARILSIGDLGKPHQLIVFLMYIELTAPVIGAILYNRLLKNNEKNTTNFKAV